jgi:hypothetical protein
VRPVVGLALVIAQPDIYDTYRADGVEKRGVRCSVGAEGG